MQEYQLVRIQYAGPVSSGGGFDVNSHAHYLFRRRRHAGDRAGRRSQRKTSQPAKATSQKLASR
jgi:hypothetical protein